MENEMWLTLGAFCKASGPGKPLARPGPWGALVCRRRGLPASGSVNSMIYDMLRGKVFQDRECFSLAYLKSLSVPETQDAGGSLV